MAVNDSSLTDFERRTFLGGGSLPPETVPDPIRKYEPIPGPPVVDDPPPLEVTESAEDIFFKNEETLALI